MKKIFKSVILLCAFGSYSVGMENSNISRQEAQEQADVVQVQIREYASQLRLRQGSQAVIDFLVESWQNEAIIKYPWRLLNGFKKMSPEYHVALVIFSSLDFLNTSKRFQNFHDEVLNRLLSCTNKEWHRIERARLLSQYVLDSKWRFSRLFEYWNFDSSIHEYVNRGGCHFHDIGTVLQTLKPRPIEYAPYLLPSCSENLKLPFLSSLCQYAYRYRACKVERGEHKASELEWVISKPVYQHRWGISTPEGDLWGTFRLGEMLDIINAIATNIIFPDNFCPTNQGGVLQSEIESDQGFYAIKHGISHLIAQTPLAAAYFEEMPIDEAARVMGACGNNKWLQQWMLINFFAKPYNIDDGLSKERSKRCKARRELMRSYVQSRRTDFDVISQELEKLNRFSAIAVKYPSKRLPEDVVKFLIRRYRPVIEEIDANSGKDQNLMDSLRSMAIKSKDKLETVVEDFSEGTNLATWGKK